jgi:hypothetical protein
MEKSLKSFVAKIGEDKLLRAIYRSDPIKALNIYGITDISYGEILGEETRNALTNLPDKNIEDLGAYAKILKFMTEHPRG